MTPLPVSTLFVQRKRKITCSFLEAFTLSWLYKAFSHIFFKTLKILSSKCIQLILSTTTILDYWQSSFIQYRLLVIQGLPSNERHFPTVFKVKPNSRSYNDKVNPSNLNRKTGQLPLKLLAWKTIYSHSISAAFVTKQTALKIVCLTAKLSFFIQCYVCEREDCW